MDYRPYELILSVLQQELLQAVDRVLGNAIGTPVGMMFAGLVVCCKDD